MSDLLFEIGTEELPAGFLLPAANQLADLFAEKAGKLQLTYTSIRRYCTPRRLAMIVSDLIDRQPDSQEELLGPSRQAAFDQKMASRPRRPKALPVRKVSPLINSASSRPQKANISNSYGALMESQP